MTGPEALAAFTRANFLVKQGQYDNALAVEMLPSDRAVIEAHIAAANLAACANTSETKEKP